MLNFFILNLFLLFYLLFTAYFSNYAPIKLKNNTKKAKKIFSKELVFASILGTVLVIVAFYYFSDWFIYSYLRIAFSALALVGAYWIGHKSKRLLYLLITLSILVIIYRFFNANYFNHNLLVLLAVFWIGPFFVNTKVFSFKKVIILSVVWALYDLYFVWLSSSFSHVNEKSTGVGFPLGLVYQNVMVGSGDLVWASLFLAIVNRKLKYWYVLIFVVVNILVGYLAFNYKFVNSLPLLVFWVPISLMLLYLQVKVLKIKQ